MSPCHVSYLFTLLLPGMVLVLVLIDSHIDVLLYQTMWVKTFLPGVHAIPPPKRGLSGIFLCLTVSFHPSFNILV